MLIHLGLSSAFFLFEKKNSMFINANDKTVTLGTIDIATDLTFSNSKISDPFYTISIPGSNHVFDQSGGTPLLITWPSHGAYNQQFRLVFTTDNDFVLTNIANGVTKCLGYDPKAKDFLRADCDATSSRFDLLYEISLNDAPAAQVKPPPKYTPVPTFINSTPQRVVPVDAGKPNPPALAPAPAPTPVSPAPAPVPVRRRRPVTPAGRGDAPSSSYSEIEEDIRHMCSHLPLKRQRRHNPPHIANNHHQASNPPLYA